jgi:uncharacterized DUF497 family protein
MSVMLFEWDEAKSRRTLSERGFGFDYAAQIFRHIISARLANRRERKAWHTFAAPWAASES